MADLKPFRAPDGTMWGVEVSNPGSSNAMVLFHHPDGSTARRDRYAWYISTGPEARSVTSRLEPKKVFDDLDDRTIARLFRRSIPVSRSEPKPNLAIGGNPGA